MAKKILKKAQPGLTVGQTNANLANQAALENVRRSAVTQYDMDTIYAASKAAYKANLEAFKLKREQERANAERARIMEMLTNPNKKAGGAITKPITALDQVDKMEKAKMLKNKKK